MFAEPDLYNRSFTTAVGERQVSYALTAETETMLTDVRSRLWSAFGALG